MTLHRRCIVDSCEMGLVEDPGRKIRTFVRNTYFRLIFSQFGSKLKDIKTQAFQKLNKKLSKLKDFVISKLNFSEKLRSLDARNEFLCSKKQINSGRNSTKQENSRKSWKTQGNYGVKTQENCQNSNFRKIH